MSTVNIDRIDHILNIQNRSLDKYKQSIDSSYNACNFGENADIAKKLIIDLYNEIYSLKDHSYILKLISNIDAKDNTRFFGVKVHEQDRHNDDFLTALIIDNGAEPSKAIKNVTATGRHVRWFNIKSKVVRDIGLSDDYSCYVRDSFIYDTFIRFIDELSKVSVLSTTSAANGDFEVCCHLLNCTTTVNIRVRSIVGYLNMMLQPTNYKENTDINNLIVH